MYDFGATLGDSMYCGHQIYYNLNDTSLFIVDSMDTVIYNGISRERLKMSFQKPGFNPITGTMYWISGIGTLIHPFYPISCINSGFCDDGDMLICYDSSYIELYHNSFFANCDTTIYAGLNDEISNDEVSILPNPASENFNINYSFNSIKQFSLQIFDLSGKQIYYTLLPALSKQSISVSHLANGIYNCVFVYDKKAINKKLVVMH